MWKKIVTGLIISTVVLTGAAGTIYGYRAGTDNKFTGSEKSESSEYSYMHENCYRYENCKEDNCTENDATMEKENRAMECYRYRYESNYSENSEGCDGKECRYEYKNRECNEFMNGNGNCPHAGSGKQNGKKK